MKKRELYATAVGLPMLAALLIGSAEPAPGCTAATFWTVEAACLAIIVAGALILRKIYKSTQ